MSSPIIPARGMKEAIELLQKEYTPDALSRYLQGLRAVRDEADEVGGRVGICYRLDEALFIQSPRGAQTLLAEHLIRTICEFWPQWSGSRIFPVSHPELERSDAYTTLPDLWDVNTPYGQARRDLLDWLITAVELATEVATEGETV